MSVKLVKNFVKLNNALNFMELLHCLD